MVAWFGFWQLGSSSPSFADPNLPLQANRLRTKEKENATLTKALQQQQAEHAEALVKLRQGGLI